MISDKELIEEVEDEEYERARERGRIQSLTIPCAVAARFEPSSGQIIVDFHRGFSISFHKSRSQVLNAASDEQLSEIEVTASGWSIYFPKLDEGLTAIGMLAGRFGNRHWERRWANEHDVEMAENVLAEPTYAVFVPRTEAALMKDSSDIFL